jgi:hypothetical protein
MVMRDISVWESGTSRGPSKTEDICEYQYIEHAELISAEADQAEVHATYGARANGTDGEVATLEVVLRVIYRTPSRMSDDFFEQFRKVTLRIHTLPFAREWLRDASARMGLGPIILPLAVTHPAAVPLPESESKSPEAKPHKRSTKPAR